MSSTKLIPPSDASRQKSGILTPTSDGSLNSKNAVAPPPDERPQSRRRASHPMAELLKNTIVLKSHPLDMTSQPCTLQQLMMLPREELPLSFLDLGGPHAGLAPSRFYDSHIKILDLEDRVADRPSMLIARNESTGRAYAIERSGHSNHKLYAVCKLGSWVDLLWLADRATVTGRHVSRMRQMDKAPESKSIHTQRGISVTPGLGFRNNDRAMSIDILQTAARKRARSQSVATLVDATRAEKRLRSDDDNASRPQTPMEALPKSHPPPKVETKPEPEPELEPKPADWIETHLDVVEAVAQPEQLREPNAQQTAGEIIESVRAQYTEALYKSMGSLAYFAKGPLSRARAAFHLDCDGNMNMNDLIEFLKSLVMTTVQIDKKYREALPDIISRMKTHFESSDEGGNKSKKKKVKKMKLGKDGMYPAEDELVRKWWESNKPELSSDEATITPAQIKSHVSLLRTRETQLQMILILEILALEPLRAADGEGESQLPGMPAVEAERAPDAQPKKRSKHNFPVLIDVHADRLCIWQSTASDEMRLLEDSQVSAPVGGGPVQKASSDSLKDFCTDIIVPFFAARLPEICDSISRKLGGPVIIAPKPKAKPSSSKAVAKPGSAAHPGPAAKRLAPVKSKSTSSSIEKALAKEQQSRRSMSRGPNNAVALLRSATSANLVGFKRERSEADRIPSADRSGSLSRSNSLSALDDAKALKKAMVEAELKNAISALRKPNREMAGKSIVEDLEKRSSGGLSQIKKSKKPTRHPLFDAVQVKVTPASHRFRDALAREPKSGSSDVAIPMSSIPPSSASRIPSTAPRRAQRDVLDSTPAAIEATPVKRGGSFVNPFPENEAAIPPSSPLTMRKPSTTHRLSVPDSVIRERRRLLRSPSPDVGLPATPCKQRTVNVLNGTVAATPVAEAPPPPSSPPRPPPPPAEKRKSIYEQLGWDDDFDDIL
ncbi:hypothetical protein C8034_v001953 [Colletotrichum sidae]|uniref:DNA replication regulator Sld3 C-terminal domain-containing protein n=1 Tax=Colletotrichum sidae TaxID=1347389 RepID=A0A4R8PMK0_9PEZI|nr:hypothetical protein C8034_v001953 [Colletotrichum sidae]